MNIQIKRIYDQPDPEDGIRVLVDRIWPRGLSTERAKVDLWLKSVAPSNDLRKWYGHEPGNWLAFEKRYFAELNANQDAVKELLACIKRGKVTLLFSSKETKYNNAMALKDYLLGIHE